MFFDFGKIIQQYREVYMPFFPIITVSYNEADNVSCTIKSVLNQSFDDYEYIVVDGASKDGTYVIENEMLSGEVISKVKISSEPDTGIYNAMNKGIEKAEGEWLIFLNAGDAFANRQVLENIAIKISETKGRFDIYYGEAIYKYKNLYKVVRTLDSSVLKFRMAFCHRCAAINKELMSKYNYDESYCLVADYNFFSVCLSGRRKISKRK